MSLWNVDNNIYMTTLWKRLSCQHVSPFSRQDNFFHWSSRSQTSTLPKTTSSYHNICNRGKIKKGALMASCSKCRLRTIKLNSLCSSCCMQPLWVTGVLLKTLCAQQGCVSDKLSFMCLSRTTLTLLQVHLNNIAAHTFFCMGVHTCFSSSSGFLLWEFLLL